MPLLLARGTDQLSILITLHAVRKSHCVVINSDIGALLCVRDTHIRLPPDRLREILSGAARHGQFDFQMIVWPRLILENFLNVCSICVRQLFPAASTQKATAPLRYLQVCPTVVPGRDVDLGPWQRSVVMKLEVEDNSRRAVIIWWQISRCVLSPQNERP